MSWWLTTVCRCFRRNYVDYKIRCLQRWFHALFNSRQLENDFIEQMNEKAQQHGFNYILYGKAAKNIIFVSSGLTEKLQKSRMTHIDTDTEPTKLIVSLLEPFDQRQVISDLLTNGTVFNSHIVSKFDKKVFWVCHQEVLDENKNPLFYFLAFKRISNDTEIQVTSSENETDVDDNADSLSRSQSSYQHNYQHEFLYKHIYKNRYSYNYRPGEFVLLKVPQFKFNRIKLPWFVIHEDSILSRMNTIMLIFLLLYIVAVVPFVIAFQIDINNTLFNVSIAVEAMLLLSIIVRFRTAIVSETTGDLIRTPKQIAANYMRGWFWPDLVGSAPLVLIVTIFKIKLNRWLLLMNMIRLFNFYRVYKKFKNLIGYGKIKFSVLVLLLLTIVHVLSCLWFGITAYWDDQTNPSTWINQLNSRFTTTTNNSTQDPLQKLHVNVLYSSAFYFVLTSYSTVGFGNISPNTYVETWLSILLMIIGIISYAILLNQMAIIISFSQNEKASNYFNKQNLRKLLKKYGFNNEHWTQIIEAHTHESNPSSQTPQLGLQQPLYSFSRNKFPLFHVSIRSIQGSKLFQEFPILSQLVDDPVISSAISSMVTTVQMESNKIFIHPNQPIAHLYVVVKGWVVASRNNQIWRIFGKHDNFGMVLSRTSIDKSLESFKSFKSIYRLQTLTNCTVYTIDLFTFLDAIEIHPEIEQIFKRAFPHSFLLQK